MKKLVCTEQVNIRSMFMRLAMYVSMYIYTSEKVSLYRASEHKIYVYASSYVCVYVHLYVWEGQFVQSKWT